MTAGPLCSAGSSAAPGDAVPCPLSGLRAAHLLPCRPGAYGGGFREYPDRIVDQRRAGASARPARGHRKHRQLPDEAQNSWLRGPRGVEPSGAEGWQLVPEVTAGARCRGEHVSQRSWMSQLIESWNDYLISAAGSEPGAPAWCFRSWG